MNLIYPSSHKKTEPENGVLYIVGTPIGNLNDLSSRAINILTNVSLIACEDTRQTKKILNKFHFTNNLISFNKINSFKKIQKLLNDLKSGKSIALVSDAGLPSICDPGEDLIKEAKLNGLNTICIPGPCAALTSLVTSGFPSSKFIFEGFLPKKKAERNKILLEISKNDKTTIIFESPNRLKKLLDDLKDFCGGEREIQVSRELTKRYEENIRDNITGVIDFFKGREVLGEITVVIKGVKKSNKGSEFDKTELKKELNDLIDAGLSLLEASKYLAKKYKLMKRLIYNLYYDERN
jgi:16S rRNA (cytidine1402-2'-O)-methyltransferase